MTTHANTVADFPRDPLPAQPARMSRTRPLYWSVRREIWENRSIYLAPLIVAAIVLFATFINTCMTLPNRMRSLPAVPLAKQHALIAGPLAMAPTPIMLAALLTGVFYALDALYGERRDRSILFWKSLPVSDRTTVLAKTSIPVVVLPLIGFVLSAFTQITLLVLSTFVLMGHGISPGRLWAEVTPFQSAVVMFYGLAVHALWFAPIYAWLLLVSAWARRTPLLWAVLPLFVIAIVERIVSNGTHSGTFLKYRLAGAMSEAFTAARAGEGGDMHLLSQLDPARFLTSAGLWMGLLFAAACLAAAMRLRRNREPI
jgi:ABC-2 type transport system permease protein